MGKPGVPDGLITTFFWERLVKKGYPKIGGSKHPSL